MHRPARCLRLPSSSFGGTLLALLAIVWFATHAHARTPGGVPDLDGATSELTATTSKCNAPVVREGLEAAERTRILDACIAELHAVTAVSSGHVARNPGQHWLTRFDGCGFRTTPDSGGWTWGLELVRYGFAGSERDVCEPSRVSACGPRIVYVRDAVLEEWWVNDSRGLEHGYTIHERPTGCGVGPLTLTLDVRGDLRCQVQDDGLGARFRTADGNEVLSYDGLSVFDANGRSCAARFERIGETRIALRIDEVAARYPLTIDPIAQRAYLKASNSGANDEFGFSVSVSGNTVVVGAPFESSAGTGVHADPSDNTAPQAGAAYVFALNGGTWSQQAYLKASNTGAVDQFGASVSVSGDTIVIGASNEASAATGVNGNELDESAYGSGAAYVFVRSGTTWSQQAYLKASNTDAGDSFGWSVSISGDTVVVGAIGESSNAAGVNGNQANNSKLNSGAAYVFTRTGGTWSQQAYVKPSNTGTNDFFGASTSVSGDTVVVGAFGEASNATGVNGNQGNDSLGLSGAAYVFVRSGTAWSQQAYLKASNTDASDRFGQAVSVSGDRVVIGAPQEDSNATGVNGNQFDNSSPVSGAAYVFDRTGSNWIQTAYLKASNTGSIDEFGQTVSVSGNSVVIGARYEQSNATGIDGNQLDESFSSAGAAYAFAWSGSSWSQTAYLKASNTGVMDQFGYAVSVDGDLVVVGAIHEDSAATGVNGSQLDNSAHYSGAAYVFVRTQTPQAICFGDGTGTACPCANAGAIGRGCANSVSPVGARMTATGVPSVSSDTLVLTSVGIPDGPGLYFQGTTSIGAGTGVAFGDGLRCVGGTVIRLGAVTAVSNTSTYPSGVTPPNGVPVSVKGFAVAGDVRHYQLWYRDSDPAYCSTSTFNLTNGSSVTWSP